MEESTSSANYALRTRLPITRVRKIFKLDPNCMIISSEAVQLLTLATERFVGLLAKVAYGHAVFDKRKTLQLRDLEFCIKNYEPFNFLDGALDGWPEINEGKRDFGNRSSIARAAKILEGISSPDADEEQEDLNVDVTGLNDEIFGFDESLEGTISTESPFDDQLVKKLNNAVTAKNTEIIEDVLVRTQSLKPEVFGHYGYYFPMNSTVATLIQTDSAKVEADMMWSKQGEEEMEVIQITDTSSHYDSLNKTGFEMAMDTL
uniref:CBFD_NFYB_HMF domain-containing protein n=1 Tax=Onchocerca volvulus TaxID=6282 RepID=A0A2K6VJ88_ONCVO